MAVKAVIMMLSEPCSRKEGSYTTCTNPIFLNPGRSAEGLAHCIIPPQMIASNAKIPAISPHLPFGSGPKRALQHTRADSIRLENEDSMSDHECCPSDDWEESSLPETSCVSAVKTQYLTWDARSPSVSQPLSENISQATSGVCLWANNFTLRNAGCCTWSAFLCIHTDIAARGLDMDCARYSTLPVS